MGRLLALLAALVVGSWIAFTNEKLPESLPVSTPATEFAGERAFADVNFMGPVPHPIGSPANAAVRDAIVGRMLLLGLNPQVRPGVGVLQSKRARGSLIAAPVENIVGVLPGRDRNAPAIALMAHYDSVPGSPGAADDIIGVASALETIRAIKARGVPARDVMVVITDGEEAGLLGANAFFRRDPLSRRIGLVFNMEARGSAGRAQMFQTSPQNGGLIDLFQRTARKPSSSSLAVLVYEKMPNDTDLTETLKAGIAGLNYAIIGSQFDYHSPTATPENLDRGSLQDMGTQVLAAAGAAAFAPQLPARAPLLVYSNLFGDVLIAYPAWVGWVIIVAAALLLAFAVRRARLAGEFPAADILRGMGALAFGALGAAAVLEFARRLTGASFGYLEQRFLLAQSLRWEWAVMLIALGFLMISAEELAQKQRRWVALVPLAAGLACSAFGEFDMIGAVCGVLAAAIGIFAYGRETSRKGAWAGALLLGLIVTVLLQALAPGAAYVVAWPLLVGTLGAAATALGARRGMIAFSVLMALAAISLGWQGGLSHFAFEALDLVPIFALPMVTAGLVLWPLAQPEPGLTPARYVGIGLLVGGLALTLIVRSADPWSPRYPDISYIGYTVDQDIGKAWRFSPPETSSGWDEQALRGDGGQVATLTHWSWRKPMLAAPARVVTVPPPAIDLARTAAGGLALTAAAPPGARVLNLQLRASTVARITAVAGVADDLALPPGQWVRVRWMASKGPLALALQAAGPGRLDVRYVAAFDDWPRDVAALPQRPTDIMPWDDSDSTFVAGTRAYAW
ncbi:MAG: M20/M25/M40 family metallo-hydrolase [Caulobacterales bacterium]|nr:M20/M25/M40 family metallo-hydrolase [Caulobacterales bacterium]